MLLSGDAVNAGGLILGVFLFHVDLQSLLVFIMPIAFGTLESLTRISRDIPTESADSRLVEDEITLGALDAGRPSIHVVRTSADCCALQHVGVGRQLRV